MANNEKDNVYPLALAFHFSVEIGGKKFPFQEVSGISAQMKTEDIPTGGMNREILRLPGQTTYSNLVLKRGLIDPKETILLSWCKETLFNQGGITSKNPIKLKNITVNLLDEKRESLIGWKFVDCYPIKLDIGGFNAQKSEIAIETIEIAYKHLNFI